MDIRICISRAIYCSLKQYGIERLTAWTLRTARRRMRLARSRPAACRRVEVVSAERIPTQSALIFAALALYGNALAAPAAVHGSLEGTRLGLYAGSDFRLVDGACADCTTVPQALWYFRDDLIAVPRGPGSGFVAKLNAQDDVRAWLAAHPAGDQSMPPLLWVGAPLVAEGARLPFAVVPKIDSNLSYYDESSERHFAGRSLRLRGRIEEGRFVARTIWPEDYALDAARVPYRPLAQGESQGESLESLVRSENGGAAAPLAARVLWRRNPDVAEPWAGKPVIAVVLNGAQGDDDEAHAGHFAIATGAFGPRGEWGDWLVNNFYNLDSVSEKGIVAASVPMDNYLADLNSGQSWYRPSYMLVAVLKDERAARLYQEGIGRVYNHFYRHDFTYRHASANCAGISMETLRSIGWTIPAEGTSGRAKAALALPYMTLKERSLESGRNAYDYLSVEVTDLYPFAAFQAAGNDLLERMAGDRGAAGTAYERMLAEDLEAVIYVRIPQFPSSRAFGQAPVASMDEYMERAPQDHSKWKIVPVAPRPFPAEMRDPVSAGDPPRASLYALGAYALALLIGAVWIWRWLSQLRTRKLRRRNGRDAWVANGG